MLTRLGERGGTGGGGPLVDPEVRRMLLDTRSLSTAGKLTGVIELTTIPTLPPAPETALDETV